MRLEVKAIKGISVVVNEGEIVTLIGANGAGKTTTLKTISGLRPLSSGSITFDGQDISKMAAHDRVRLGISQAPEGRGIFSGMTVLENLEMGKYHLKMRKSEIATDLERMIANIFRIITEINKQGVTILLVEQNAQQALSRAHRAYVLETGSITKEAKASDLLNDPHVKAAYLGTGANEIF
jgi:branched-chain amino acid transport system ATP-binding protein